MRLKKMMDLSILLSIWLVLSSSRCDGQTTDNPLFEEKCEDGVWGLVRTPGVTLAENGLPISDVQTDSLSCAQRCLQSNTCTIITRDESRGQCVERDPSLELQSVLPKWGSSTTEKVCLQSARSGVECPQQVWTYMRQLNVKVLSKTNKELKGVTSHLQCAQLCSNETDFQCLSASYNRELLECHLHEEISLLNTDGHWEYMQKQCTERGSRTLHQFTQRTNMTLQSLEATAQATDLKQCEVMCDQEIRFVCRSIWFAESKCCLSTDPLSLITEDRPIFPLLTTSNNTAIVAEREELFTPQPTAGAPAAQARQSFAGRCPPGVPGTVLYEKVTGYRPGDSSGNILYANTSRGITQKCLEQCDINSTKCDSLGLDYETSTCVAFSLGAQTRAEQVVVEQTDVSEGQVVKAVAYSYFRPLCFASGAGCGRLWVMERFPQRRLEATPYMVILQLTRHECEARCLEDDLCHSANFGVTSGECALLRESRYRLPEAFQEASGVEYLENQCTLAPPSVNARQFSMESCQYINTVRDRYLLFVDKIVNANEEFDCRAACDAEVLFNCRSYSFIPPQQSTSQQCYLSADMQTSVGAQLKVLAGAVYAERSCTQQLPSNSIFPALQNPFQPPQPPPFFPANQQLPGGPGPMNQMGPMGPMNPMQPFPGPARCFYPTDFTYEKTMGMVPRPGAFMSRVEPLPLLGPQSLAEDCARECTQRDTRCLSFVLQYPMGAAPSCLAFDRPVASERGLFVSRPDAAYLEKVCLRGRRCGKLWTFERVVGFALEGSDTRELRFVMTKEDCEDHCLAESSFECRSAEYIYSMQLCRLSTETRRSRPEAFHFVGPDVDYLENQCASDPVECKYTEFPAKMLPYADRFVPGMLSLDDCQTMCDRERNFLCRSVTWNHVSSDCLLSADDRYSTLLGQNAITDRATWVYSEKGNCGQVRVECNPTEMLVSVVFGSPFNGRVYAKGNPQLCTMAGNARMNLLLPVPLGVQCGTVQEAPGRFANEVVVQQHPMIMTDSDKTYRVVCSFAAVDKIVTLGPGSRLDGLPGGALDVVGGRGMPPTVVENTAPTPEIQLRITARNGQDVSTVGLGDELLFRLEPDPRSSLGIFARNLMAKSEFNEFLPLLDPNGCPTDISVFPPLGPEPGSRALVAPFRAFRFASTGRINFEVQVSFCQDMCPPVQCVAGAPPTMGRRKRSPQSVYSQQPQLAPASHATQPLPPPVTVQYTMGPSPPTQQEPQQASHPSPQQFPQQPPQQFPQQPPQQFPNQPSQQFRPPQPQQFPQQPSPQVVQQPPQQAPNQHFRQNPQQPQQASNPSYYQGPGAGHPYNPYAFPSSQMPSNNPYAFYPNLSLAPPATWGQTGPPKAIPIPLDPVFARFPAHSDSPRPSYNITHAHNPTISPPSKDGKGLRQVPLRLSLNVNSQEDDRGSASGITESRHPQLPPVAPPTSHTYNPANRGKYDVPIIREMAKLISDVAGFPANVPVDRNGTPLPEKACSDKGPIATAVVATLGIQLVLMIAAFFCYRRVQHRRQRKRRAGLMAMASSSPGQPNVLYGPSPAAFGRLGIRDKLQSGQSTLKVTNWMQQQQQQQQEEEFRPNRDPNRLNIMDMARWKAQEKET